ncbi:MAG: lamin tail domain-containing protein, partial [Bacteroidales bacterium]|nr:lamin tail domain-containing protein [Bacteroidales bacterium]
MNRTLTLWRVFALALALIIAPAILSGPLQAQTTVFINEIHYDNSSTDVAEAIEIAGPAGTDLAEYQLFFYNAGSSGTSSSLSTTCTPNPRQLSGVIQDEGNGYGTICFLIPNLENGPNDGILLYYSPLVGTPSVIQFLSYEGVHSANVGPAAGLTSVDIGVTEGTSTQVGYSLQLAGFGTDYEDFYWEGPITATCGTINTNQVMAGTIDYCAEILSFDLPGQTGPAVIDTVNNTVHVEVFGGTNVSALIPTFTLCLYASAQDTLTPANTINSTTSVVDFSDTVVWNIIGEVPYPETYEIIVTLSAVQLPKVVINEVDYDQPGVDAGEFIELKNVGTLPANLNGMKVKLVNGSSGGASIYSTTVLPDTLLQPNQYFVICASPSSNPECDMLVAPPSPDGLIQNGPPDAIALTTASDLILDMLSYEGSVPGYTEASGAGLEDLTFLAPYTDLYDAGLSRYPDGSDTDNNATDFIFTCTTPGAPNGNTTVPCRCVIADVVLDAVTGCVDPGNAYTATIVVTHFLTAGQG